MIEFFEKINDVFVLLKMLGYEIKIFKEDDLYFVHIKKEERYMTIFLNKDVYGFLKYYSIDEYEEIRMAFDFSNNSAENIRKLMLWYFK